MISALPASLKGRQLPGAIYHHSEWRWVYRVLSDGHRTERFTGTKAEVQAKAQQWRAERMAEKTKKPSLTL